MGQWLSSVQRAVKFNGFRPRPPVKASNGNSLRMLLKGKVGQVIGGLRRMLTVHGRIGEMCRTLQGVIRYDKNLRETETQGPLCPNLFASA